MNSRLTFSSGCWEKLRRRYHARRAIHRRVPWLGFILSAINCVAIAFFVFDTPVGLATHTYSPALVLLAAHVTDIGRLLWVLMTATVILVVGFGLQKRLSRLRHKFRLAYAGRMLIYLLCTMLSASALTHILKVMIGRARPPLFETEGVLGFHPWSHDFIYQSFPSGHATHIGALFMALILLFPRFKLLFFGIGLWLGATRIILDVHYPSDVVAGLAIGAGTAFVIAILFARFGFVFSVPLSGWPQPRLRQIWNWRKKTGAFQRREKDNTNDNA